MNILVTSWIHRPHRERGLAAVALVLSLLLSACTVPTQPATLPTSQPPKAEPAIRNLHQAAYNDARYQALAL